MSQSSLAPVVIPCHRFTTKPLLSVSAQKAIEDLIPHDALTARRPGEIVGMARTMIESDAGFDIATTTNFFTWEDDVLSAWDYDHLSDKLREHIRETWAELALDITLLYEISKDFDRFPEGFESNILEIWQFRHGAVIVPPDITSVIQDGRTPPGILLFMEAGTSAHDKLQQSSAASAIQSAAGHTSSLLHARGSRREIVFEEVEMPDAA